MNKRINFEDNLFILLRRIQIIRDMLILDADPELFMEKLLEDIDFNDQTLNFLLGQLQENDRLLGRDEFLEQFAEVEGFFSRVLGDLLDHEGDYSIREIPVLMKKITALRENSLERRKVALEFSPMGDSVNGVPIVSTDELTELLKAL